FVFSVSAPLASSSPRLYSSLCFVLSVSTADVLVFSLSSAPLVSLFPLFRRTPYLRLQLLQEPIPRTGVAINHQPQKGYGRFRAYPCVDERACAACAWAGAFGFGCGSRYTSCFFKIQ